MLVLMHLLAWLEIVFFRHFCSMLKLRHEYHRGTIGVPVDVPIWHCEESEPPTALAFAQSVGLSP